MCYYLVTKNMENSSLLPASDTIHVAEMTTSAIAHTVPTYADAHQPSEDTVLIIELSKLAWAKLLRILMRKYSFVKDKKKSPFHEGAFLYNLQSSSNGRQYRTRGFGSLC